MNTELSTLVENLEHGDLGTDLLVERAHKCLSQLQAAPEIANKITLERLGSSDGVLDLINAIVPGWSVHITGKAYVSDGHWTCTLRRSSGRDNDEFVGIGRGTQLHHALLSALLRTADFAL